MVTPHTHFIPDSPGHVSGEDLEEHQAADCIGVAAVPVNWFWEDFRPLVALDLSPCEGLVGEASLPSASPVVLPGFSACVPEGEAGDGSAGVEVHASSP